ncbi:endonuclease III [Fundicoccus culcitae]|uniref:Endonuclease III n=1 Tax=Fundicoccus culcitae TaxID=2969821 RepID=A0ABY5P6M4_9LACT|nr:endonuclease III [Fundicoccus culcitae]UUX34130.1 endonuclease III [Fundicoccus culcitae]
MMTKKKMVYALDQMAKLIPNAETELKYSNTYELLIAVMLSAQTTDKAVNKVTPKLFERYPTPQALAESSAQEIEPYIQTIGLYRNKAKFVYQTGVRLVEAFNGEVPNNRKDLESLPGVGRKTANVILSVAFDKPAIAVDTHVSRVSKRLGIVSEDATLRQVEDALMDLIPEERWGEAHQLLVLFGRYYCTARSPKCSEYLNFDAFIE